jgi:AcrR family transcriptional regulator
MMTTEDGDGRISRRIRLSAAERRETILRAAAEVFAGSGYRAAKVSDVAAQVGVSEPVVFQNFGSKAALFAAVIERAATAARDSLDELTAGPGPTSQLLAHVLTGPDGTEPGHFPSRDRVRDGGGHAGTAYGVLFADAAVLATEPDLAGSARDAVQAVAAHLADLVRHAQANGGARPDADPEAAAWLLLSVLAARRLRTAAMPEGLESAVTALVLQALALPAAETAGHGQRPPA